jgi:hypothetical protein
MGNMVEDNYSSLVTNKINHLNLFDIVLYHYVSLSNIVEALKTLVYDSSVNI